MKRLLVLFFIFFAFSCSNRTGIPNDVIPMESMQKIMADIILANNYSNDFVQKDTTKKDKVLANQDLLAMVFKIHRTTAADFKRSLVFYESRPDLSKKIFDSLDVYNNIHRKDDYKPIGNAPAHPITKPPLGPNGKPLITPHKILPLNQHMMPLHNIPQHKIPPHTTPAKKPPIVPPVKQTPVITR